MKLARSSIVCISVAVAATLSACSASPAAERTVAVPTQRSTPSGAPSATAPTCRLDPDTGFFSDCDPGAPNSPSPSEKAETETREHGHGLVVLKDFGKLSDAATLDLVDVMSGSSTYTATFTLNPKLTVSGSVSTDLTYLAARQQQDDGTQHGGFIDQSGTFYDASAPFAQSGSFAGGLNTDRVAFIGDRLYFNLRSTSDNSTDTIYSVPAARVTSNEATAADYHKESVAAPVYADAIPKFAPDGTVTKQTNGCIKAYGKWAFNPDGFVGSSSYVALHDETILEYPLRASCYKSFINGKALLPSSDQAVTQLAVSPDSSEVAFTAQRNQQSTWYTVPVGGGNPTQVGDVGGANGSLIGWR